MKSLEELKALREKARENIGIRHEKQNAVRVLVGVATCGIAAGARPVLSALVAEVQKEKLEDVIVSQTGCMGLCQQEPTVEVIDADGTKTTYVKMTPEKAIKVIHSHIIGKKPIAEYTFGR